jgi:hypothetical protein
MTVKKDKAKLLPRRLRWKVMGAGLAFGGWAGL